MTHAEFTPHAFITISNCGGIEIMLNKSNDGVYYRFNHGQDNLENEEIFEAEIEYRLYNEDIDSNDEDAEFLPCFKHEYANTAAYYFLNEAMRIN